MMGHVVLFFVFYHNFDKSVKISVIIFYHGIEVRDFWDFFFNLFSEIFIVKHQREGGEADETGTLDLENLALVTPRLQI